MELSGIINKNKLRKALKNKRKKLNKKNNTIIDLSVSIVNNNSNTTKDSIITNNINYDNFPAEIQSIIQSFEDNAIKKNNTSTSITNEDNGINYNIIDNNDDDNKINNISKKIKKQNLMSISQLKVLSDNPALIESWDITSPDPLLLIKLKSLKNTIKVPKTWERKKNSNLLYNMFSKRKEYILPKNIENTGIGSFRDPMLQRDSIKMIKQKIKERMAPRLNKIDLDYEMLYDAFFKNNIEVNNNLKTFGDIFIFGVNTNMTEFKPGQISDELKEALGVSDKTKEFIPPWIINMQKFGMPPSYPFYEKIYNFNINKFLKKYNNSNNNSEKVNNNKYLFGEMKEKSNNNIFKDDTEEVKNIKGTFLFNN